MDSVLEFIASVNKISLVAFVGVFGFLVYELNLLLKERAKKQKPVIPQFNTNAVVDTKVVVQQAAAIAVAPKKQENNKKVAASPLLIVILIVMIVIFLGVSVYLLINGQKEKKATVQPTVVVQEISSPGLKVFNSSWQEVSEADAVQSLAPGTKVFIGIQTIDGADIDRGRIKVNEKEWNIAHITNAFNEEKKVYYREYTVATGESQLKIDAQLHSEVDGWLGD